MKTNAGLRRLITTAMCAGLLSTFSGGMVASASNAAPAATPNALTEQLIRATGKGLQGCIGVVVAGQSSNLCNNGSIVSSGKTDDKFYIIAGGGYCVWEEVFSIATGKFLANYNYGKSKRLGTANPVLSAQLYNLPAFESTKSYLRIYQC